MNKRQKLTLIFSIQLVLVSSLFLINIYDQIKINPVLAKKLDYPLVKTVVKNIDQTSQKFDNVLSKPATVKKQMAIINSDTVKQVKENTQEKSLPLEDKIVINPVIMENQPISLTNTSYENSIKDIVSKLDIWDAQITSVNPSNTSPYIDDTISINMTVKNTSNQLASFKYVVKVVDSSNNQKFYDYSTIYDIPVNNSRSKTFSWKVNLVGNFRILAEVWDPGWREKFDSYSSSTYTSRARPFINPSISRDNSYISPSTLKQGDTFTAYFNVNNQNSNSVKIGLGVTIRNKNTQVEYYDVSHDTTVWINSGTSTQSRLFKIPDNIPVGDYEYVFAIWSELPPNGTWFGSTGWKSPLAIQANFQNPTINDHYISPTTINKNETFNIYYYVYNPNSSNINVGLGASIRKIGVYNDGLSDPNNDKIVTIPSGYSWQSRSFRVPSEAQSGANQYIIKLWSSTPGSSSEYAKTNWTSGPTIPQAKGSLTATIKNVGSTPQTIPGSDGLIKLYTISGNYVTEKTTTNINGNGAVTFDSLTPGDYYIKAYYQKGPWGAEYWGQSSNQTAPEGGSTIFEFTRNNPYMTDINFYRGDTESKVDVNSTLMEGDKVRAEVDIYNATNSDLNLTHTLLLDQSQSSSYDFEESKTVLVNANSSKRLTYYIYPQKISIYYRAMRLQLNDGSIIDGWSWHEAIKITAFPPVYNNTFVPTPLNGQTDVPSLVTLKWDNAFTDPENKPLTYELYLGKNQSNLIKYTIGSNTYYNATLSDHDTIYYWQVKATDSQGLSATSPLWNFTSWYYVEPKIPAENIILDQDKLILEGFSTQLSAAVNDPYLRNPLIIEWRDGYTSFGNGPTATLLTPTIGTHTITVKVLYNSQEIGSKTMQVIVKANDVIRTGEIQYIGREVNGSGFVAPQMLEPLKLIPGLTETYRIELVNITDNILEVFPKTITTVGSALTVKVYDEWGQAIDSNWKLTMTPQSVKNIRVSILGQSNQITPFDTGVFLEVLLKSNSKVIGERYLNVKLINPQEWFSNDLTLAASQVGAIYDYLIGDDIRDFFDGELPVWRRSLALGSISANFIGIKEIKVVINAVGKTGAGITAKEIALKDFQLEVNQAVHQAKKEMLEETLVNAADHHVFAQTLGREASYNAFKFYNEDLISVISKIQASDRVKNSSLAIFINRFKDLDEVAKTKLLNSLENLATNNKITKETISEIAEKLNKEAIEKASANAAEDKAINAIGDMLKTNRLNQNSINNMIINLEKSPYALEAIEKLTRKEIYNDFRFIDNMVNRFKNYPVAIESFENIANKVATQVSDVDDTMLKKYLDIMQPDKDLAELFVAANKLQDSQGNLIAGVIKPNGGNSFFKEVLEKGVWDPNSSDILKRTKTHTDDFWDDAVFKVSQTAELKQSGKNLVSFNKQIVMSDPKNPGKYLSGTLDAIFLEPNGKTVHYAFKEKALNGFSTYNTKYTFFKYYDELVPEFESKLDIIDLYDEWRVTPRLYTREFDMYAKLVNDGQIGSTVWVVNGVSDTGIEVFRNRYKATIIGESLTKKYLVPGLILYAAIKLPDPVIATNSGEDYVTKERTVLLKGLDNSGSDYILINGSVEGVNYDTITGVWSKSVQLNNGSNTFAVTAEDVNGQKSDPRTINITYDSNAPEVYANHAAGTFDQPVEVTLRTNENATIYYTLDGSEPTISSTVYTNPITINQTTTIKYFAVDGAGNVSQIQVDEYVISIPVPQAPKITDYQADTNQQKQLIKGTKDANTSLIMVQESVNIRHEILPLGSETNWQYEVAHTFEGVNRYLFYLVNSQGKQSDITTIQINRDTQAPVVKVQPAGGTYATVQKVTLSSDEATAEIIITTGDDLSARRCVGSCTIDINQTTTLRYSSMDSLGNRSGTLQENYIINNIKPNPPIINPYPEVTKIAGYKFSGTKDLNTSLIVNGHEIYMIGQDTIWTSYVYLNEGYNEIKFTSKNSFGLESEIALVKITRDTTAPSINILPAGGIYNKRIEVKLSSNETNSKIYYKFIPNGVTTISDYSEYSLSIKIDKTGTLNYYATDIVGNQSETLTETYTINSVELSAPIVDSYPTLTNQTRIRLIGRKDPNTSLIINNQEIIGIGNSTLWETDYNLSEGINEITLLSRDQYNNQSPTTSIKITLDTIGPIIRPSVLTGTYDKVLFVTLNSNENAKIYYSLDGINPTKNSKLYKYPIRIDKNTTLKILAEDDLGNQAYFYREDYIINLAKYQTINLTKDFWKMISVASQTTDLEGTFGEEQEIYQYNHETAKYQKITDKLRSGQAYWIKVKENKTIHIPIDDFNADNFPPASYNQGFAMISGELLKYTANLRLNNGIDTKTLSEAVDTGWLKSNAYYFEDNSYKVMDLRSITNNDVAGRSFWIRLYRPITFSFDGTWKTPAHSIISDIPKIN